MLQGNSINMMNDLANRVLSEMTNMHDFFMNREKTGEKSLENLLDKKLFFLFVGAGSTKKDKKNVKKKKGKGTSSDFSKYTSSHSTDEKMEYSIRDFQQMEAAEMNSKVFTFDQDVSKNNDVTK